jgi:hypothetical protein
VSTVPTEALLRWRGVALHPLRDTDLGWLRQAELGDYLAFRWRLRGEHVPPSEYAASLWSSTFVNFIVASDRRPNDPAGIISAYELDATSAHCKVAVAAFHASTRPPTFRGLLMTLDYLFTGWPLNKIYFDVPAFNVAQLAGGIREHVDEEGVLRHHVYLAGRYHDLHLWALYRHRWESLKASLPSWPTPGQQ